jgi:probable F420-dependent oxidoreductase
MGLGPIGVWGTGIWLQEARRQEATEVAAELEELGYTSLWLSAGFGSGVPALFDDLLGATRTLTVASGILSIWHSTPAQTATAVADLQRDHPGRFMLGLGASHAPRVERNGQEYARPYSRMVDYLDALDQGTPATPPERRVLAALGPRMLRLSADRSAGAHPYFVPVEHTAYAREVLGEGPLLVPEQAVVLETDPERARAIARHHMARYLGLPNYTNNLRRLGWAESDVAGGGSDQLVDAIVAWGEPGAVTERLQAHLDAGADTVLVQALGAEREQFPRHDYRALAGVLF